MGIRKKAKDKQRAMQVLSYTYARMTRRWRSAPNRCFFYFHLCPVSICFLYLPRELVFSTQIDKRAPRVTSTCLVSLGHLLVLLVVHQRPSYIRGNRRKPNSSYWQTFDWMIEVRSYLLQV